MADELIVLKDGEILEHGKPRELYNDRQYLYTARLLTNSNVLTREEAAVVGIRAEKEHLVIYPEWIQVTNSLTRRNWTIRHILFKGAYDELALEREGVILRAIISNSPKYQPGSHVHVKINRWLQY